MSTYSVPTMITNLNQKRPNFPFYLIFRSIQLNVNFDFISFFTFLHKRSIAFYYISWSVVLVLYRSILVSFAVLKLNISEYIDLIIKHLLMNNVRSKQTI